MHEQQRPVPYDLRNTLRINDTGHQNVGGRSLEGNIVCAEHFEAWCIYVLCLPRSPYERRSYMIDRPFQQRLSRLRLGHRASMAFEISVSHVYGRACWVP